MRNLWRQLRRRAFGISLEETTFARRGFRTCEPAMRERLEHVAATFVEGYHIALEAGGCDGLPSRLDSVPLERRGFAYEGAAMGLALLDSLSPARRRRVAEFLDGAGRNHCYMVHVGVGWVWARLKFSMTRTRRMLDPLLQWLAFDGWGFHEGFFHWPRYAGGATPPLRLSGYDVRAFDQGLGRSLWFINGGDPQRIAQTIADFGRERQSDLWSGVGLAATYAGIVQEPVLEQLLFKAGPYWPHLCQGAAFAAKARERAGNRTAYTELAVRKLSGLSVDEASALCDSKAESVAGNPPDLAYELWRQSIQNHFQKPAMPQALVARSHV